MVRSLTCVAVVLASILATAAGCSAVTDEDAASAEENLDAFGRPTEHGALGFDRSNDASFTEDQRFHAWTFTLTAPAQIALSTELRAQNLDTVAYLYKKGAGGWGQYVATNDNSGGTLASRINGRFDAGEYMLKIKARHASMRGAFAVLGQCTGAGCPSANVTCAAPPAAFPSGGTVTTACAATMAAILTTPSGASPSAACDAKMSEAAAKYYEAYFRDMGDDVWEELNTDGIGEGGAHHPGAGTVLNLDVGGDENAMSYVFDAQQRPMLYFQHNQSPAWEWSCNGGDPIPEEEQPNDTCIGAMLGHHTYGPSDVREGNGTTFAGVATGTSPQIDAALAEYGAGVPAGTALTFTYRAWKTQFDMGAEVKIKAAGSAETAYVVVGSPGWGLTVALATTAGKTKFVCKTTY